MEKNKLDYDSDVIVCDTIPETVVVTSSPENTKSKKKKMKKPKRKVKRGIGFNNIENLLITQKVHIKKKKIKCVININRVYKERKSDSIVRFATNVCKKEAYYHRILPICLRAMCQNEISRNCCRLAVNQIQKDELNPKCGSLSPISSVASTEIFGCSNLSYEDVSDGNFSTASEDDLDTLIMRTKQREKHFEHLNSARQYVSTPISKMDDTASPYSVEMDKSIHSDSTMILNPLSIEAYSPNASLDAFNIVNFDRHDYSNNMVENDDSYSSIIKPVLIKNENYSCVEDDIPYCPTYTQESMEIENIDFNGTLHGFNDVLYSPTFIPDLENLDNKVARGDHSLKIEEFNKSTTQGIPGNVSYSPSSPTKSPDLMKSQKSDTRNDLNNLKYRYSARVTLGRIKVENTDSEPEVRRKNANETDSPGLITDLINKERPIDCNRLRTLNVNDFNMNNTRLMKEKRYYQSERTYSQDGANKVVIKVEKDDQNNVIDSKTVHSNASTEVFTNSFVIKSEDIGNN